MVRMRQGHGRDRDLGGVDVDVQLGSVKNATGITLCCCWIPTCCCCTHGDLPREELRGILSATTSSSHGDPWNGASFCVSLLFSRFETAAAHELVACVELSAECQLVLQLRVRHRSMIR